MFLNHMKKSVHDAEPGEQSLCPDCGADLIAKKGEKIVWHWSHHPGQTDRECFAGGETNWHLSWKRGYHKLEGWEIEVPYEINGKKYRLDTFQSQGGKVREFVHSLSDSYVRKHQDLAQSGLNVLWIIDGEEFGSIRKKKVGKDSKKSMFKKLLKPKCAELFENIGFDHCLVHYKDDLYKYWDHGIWVKADTPITQGLLSRFNVADGGERMKKVYSGFSGDDLTWDTLSVRYDEEFERKLEEIVFE